MNSKPRIVVLGAGYAGIAAVQRLQRKLTRKEADVVLINKHEYHYLTTRLHRTAAGTESPSLAQVPIRTLIDPNVVQLRKSTVSRIHPQEARIELGDGNLAFDYLIVGLGGEPETFGIPGIAEHALCLRSLNSVRLIKQHIEYQFAKFKLFPHQPEHLTIVVAGAGLTGSEFAGELLDRIPQLCRQFDVAPGGAKVYLIDAAPTALPPGFPAEHVDYALEHFRKQGAIMRLSAPVERIKPDSIVLIGGDEIKSSTVIWAGGIRGSRLLQEAGFPVQRGQALVADNLLIRGYDRIFAVGDSALLMDDHGKPYPSNAQTAIQQGTACADNVLASLRGIALKPCRPHIRGALVSLGSGKAVGVVGTRIVKGRPAMLLKEWVGLKYLMQIGGLRLLLQRAARAVSQSSTHPK